MRLLRALPLLLLSFAAAAAGAATIDNDDSCDIIVLPAATLLLPYFEVDLDDPNGETTLFTVTNVTNVDRIARVTLWTDRAYPVIAFNIYLTGYDVQAINLFDVIARGRIAPDAGTGTAVSKRGTYSDQNFEIDLTGCGRLPGALDALSITRMRSAFLNGSIPASGATPACNQAGGVHENAVGYATIDVVRTCSSYSPDEPLYWVEDIAFENVLTGDTQQVDSKNNFAQGNPLVHIRAIPEGGTPAQRRARPAAFDAGFPRTFYSRYQKANEPRFDGRQPLPSAFAARWIAAAPNSFQTSLKVWREGNTGSGASCADYNTEKDLEVGEIVRLDEAENAASDFRHSQFPDLVFPVELPPSSRTDVGDVEVFQQLTNGAVAGWLYLNLDKCGLTAKAAQCGNRPATQGWIVTSLRAEGRYSVDSDALALGNGCSPRVTRSELAVVGGVVIGPAPNSNH
jgi:hypothetical protein